MPQNIIGAIGRFVTKYCDLCYNCKCSHPETRQFQRRTYQSQCHQNTGRALDSSLSQELFEAAASEKRKRTDPGSSLRLTA